MNNRVHDATINQQGQVVFKKQYSVLSKSLLIAGVGFILIFAFSFGLYQLLWQKMGYTTNNNVIISLYAVSILMLLATIIMAMIVVPRIMKVKLGSIIALTTLYGLANGISFGVLFYAVQTTSGVQDNFNVGGLCWCFLIAGGIFLLTGFIGTLLSVRFTLSLGKFLMIATLIYFVAFLVIVILSICGVVVTDKVFLAIYGIWGFLMCLYVMLDFSMIKKSQPFISMQEDSIQTKFVWMFGFMLLVDLIQLVWVAIRIYLITRR